MAFDQISILDGSKKQPRRHARPQSNRLSLPVADLTFGLFHRGQSRRARCLGSSDWLEGDYCGRQPAVGVLSSFLWRRCSLPGTRRCPCPRSPKRSCPFSVSMSSFPSSGSTRPPGSRVPSRLASPGVPIRRGSCQRQICFLTPCRRTFCFPSSGLGLALACWGPSASSIR